jgi:hypothetical protein
MVDGTGISSRKEVEGLNRTAAEDGWMEAMAASLVCCVLKWSRKTHGFPTGTVTAPALGKPVLRPRTLPAAADLTLVVATPTSKTQDVLHRLPSIHSYVNGQVGLIVPMYSISSCHLWYCKYWTSITASTCPPRRLRQRGNLS